MKEKILIVEDEKDIIKMLEYNLKKEGFTVQAARNGEDALDKTHKENPDLIILDLMLPGMDGLELGADDYVTKPFSPRELIARIKAILRRGREKDMPPEILRTGELTMDFSKISVNVKGKPIKLTAKEFELLKTLIRVNGRVLSRDYLLDTIWGMDHAVEIQTRTVDAHIRTLRKKLKSEAARVVTVKNYGYRFEKDL